MSFCWIRIYFSIVDNFCKSLYLYKKYHHILVAFLMGYTRPSLLNYVAMEDFLYKNKQCTDEKA